jgi:trk system potassium uptake protein TrkA
MLFIGIQLDEKSPLARIPLSKWGGKVGERKILVAAISRNDKMIIPTGNDWLEPGDLVYFISEKEQVTDSLALFGRRVKPAKRVMIIGGGRIGLRLAKILEGKNINPKIVENNAKRCAQLAELLNKSIILHGDGSDQSLLNEENIQNIDAVVTLTNDEETNILTSLLAKRMGARKVITKISKFSYFPVMLAINMEQVVNPRLSAINTILQYIRRGKVLSALSLKGEQAEVLEAIALETSEIVNKPLKKISFPKGAILTGIMRNDHVVIPSGDTVVEPGDRIVIFARKDAIPKVEKFLTVKLEYF